MTRNKPDNSSSMTETFRQEADIDAIIQNALAEDLAHGGDATTDAIITDQTAQAVMRARQAGVAAGLDVAKRVFETVDPSLQMTAHAQDGDTIAPNQNLLSIDGSAASILKAERTALNLAMHLSGVASLTRKYVDLAAGTGAQIACTRKTLPGLRALEKQAVLAGGGINHRFSLGDMILIKDNHIAIAGGIKQALDAVKSKNLKIMIEVDTLEQLREVLDHGGADYVLLDNMDAGTLKTAVALCKGKIITEASGGVNLETVRAIAQTGVDRISVGALTHSAPALDIGLDIDIA